MLIQKRNQRVLDDLTIEMRHRPAPASVAVFYGTGHMPDLELRVCRDLGYRPSGEIWFSAMTADLGQAGVTEAESRFLTNLLQQQLEQFGAGPKSP